ncbi:MAG: lysophospholipid acyltransferase family protein [Bacteroidales bacterium]
MKKNVYLHFKQVYNHQMFMQKLAQAILKAFGWTYEAKTPYFMKSVLVVAPHTSNWDFIMGKLGYLALGRDAHFVIKKDWMVWPIGILFRKMGGIPVDRSRANKFTDQIAGIYKSRERFNLAITPEGTRKRNPRWKRGFYHIALKANVPIVLVKIDYGTKHMCVCEVFTPTGDEAADMHAIQQRYKDVVAKHPAQFSIGE